MLAVTGRSTDSVDRAIYLITTRGVEVVRGTAVPTAPLPPDHPILYVLEPGQAGPSQWSELEDWIRLPVGATEVRARAERLLARAARHGAVWIHVDDDDVLCAGQQRAPLSPMNARLVRLLLSRSGSIVSRAEIEAHLWPDGQPDGARALDNVVRHLRQRLADVPVRIHTARSRGFVLERVSIDQETREAS